MTQMPGRRSGGLKEFVHHHFLWLLIGAYALAAHWPQLGETIRRVSVNPFDSGLVLSLPMVLLGVLLFNAGLGADPSEFKLVLRHPRMLLLGVAANVLVPVAVLILLALGLRCWPDPDEAQCLLVGLAVVAAMPVAGSSTAWSQNASGSAALSLGLVITSTMLSPLTTPVTLAVLKPLTTGQYTDVMGQLSGSGTGLFLLACVAVPSLAGMACRFFVGERLYSLKPALKLINSLVLLLLCYANSSSVLPLIFRAPDWDFLALCLVAVGILCVTAFTAGWGLARMLRAGKSQTRSLTFALGMNNNGTGIVLACTSLAAFPGAVLPVLIYNLVQHIVAGGVNRRLQDQRSSR